LVEESIESLWDNTLRILKHAIAFSGVQSTSATMTFIFPPILVRTCSHIHTNLGLHLKTIIALAD
jgi:hypothetical protein